MWIVVYKMDNYPSVFEFQTKKDAIDCYNKLKRSYLFNGGALDMANRLYISEVKEFFGHHKWNVSWGLDDILEMED